MTPLSVEINSLDSPTVGQPVHATGWGDNGTSMLVSGEVRRISVCRDSERQFGITISDDGSIVLTDYRMGFQQLIPTNLCLKPTRPWDRKVSAHMTNQPTPRRSEYLDYNECRKWIEQKLGYNLRDTLGKFADGKCSDNAEYRDYWHFLIDNLDITNGCERSIGCWLLEDGNDWQNEITQAFIKEFGPNAIYRFEW